MFVCCPEKEAKKRMNKLNDLKQLVETIEEKMAVPCALVPPCCPPPCPPCCPNGNNANASEPAKEPSTPPPPPDIMVCYKFAKIEKKRNGRPAKKNPGLVRTKRAKSRELRASILYVDCDCEKRNGLQDDCRRTDCQGSPECLTNPPTCGPSEFCDGKHLYKKYGIGVDKIGTGEGNANADDDANGRVAVYYNCYPAAIKC